MRLVPTLDGKEFEAAAFLHGNFPVVYNFFFLSPAEDHQEFPPSALRSTVV